MKVDGDGLKGPAGRPSILIGDLAFRTGLSLHTLNYYLRLGLVEPESRSPRSGYRLFSERTVEVLRRIVALRRRGVPIREIARMKADGLL